MKGQIFVILAVVSIAILVAIRASFKGITYKQSREIWKNKVQDKTFQNVIEETQNIIDFFYPNYTKINENMAYFLDFVGKKMRESGINFQAIYVGVLSNSTSSTLNVTIFNYLGKNISATLEVDGQQKNLNVNNNQTTSTYFTTIGNVTITFEDYMEEISVKNNGISGFVDEHFLTENFDLRKKITRIIEG